MDVVIMDKRKKNKGNMGGQDEEEEEKTWGWVKIRKINIGIFKVRFYLGASFEDLDLIYLEGTRATVKIFFQLALFLFRRG